MQLSCKHAHVAEFKYREDPFGHNHTPPYRVCADCGFAEYGWNCGWQILTHTANRTEAERVGPIYENHLFVPCVSNSGTKQSLYESRVKAGH
jgi:hypothetical protein